MLKEKINKIVSLLVKPTSFFLIIGIFFGLYFVITNPPGFGLDERAHFLRTYEIAQGSFMPTRTGPDHHQGAELPTNLTKWVDSSTSDLLDNNDSLSIFKRHDAEMSRYTVFFHEQFSTTKTDDSVSDSQLAGTFNYSPIGYLHLALVVWIGEALKFNFLYIFYLTRIANLLVYLAIVYLAIRLIPRHKWILAMVALWPVALFQASIISVDPVINAVSFLLFALLIKFWHQKDGTLSKYEMLLPILLLSFLALEKQPYIVLFIPFLLIPKRIYRDENKATTYKILWALIPIIVGVVWFEIDKNNSLQAISSYGGVNFTKQIDLVIQKPYRFIAVILNSYFQVADGYFGSMVGDIGDRLIGISLIYMSILSFLTVGIASVFKFENEKNLPELVSSKINKIVISGVVFLAIFAISLSLYAGFTAVGASMISGIQGRYFLPLIPFIGILLGSISPLKLSINKAQAIRLMTISCVTLLGVTAALYTIVNF